MRAQALAWHAPCSCSAHALLMPCMRMPCMRCISTSSCVQATSRVEQVQPAPPAPQLLLSLECLARAQRLVSTRRVHSTAATTTAPPCLLSAPPAPPHATAPAPTPRPACLHPPPSAPAAAPCRSSCWQQLSAAATSCSALGCVEAHVEWACRGGSAGTGDEAEADPQGEAREATVQRGGGCTGRRRLCCTTHSSRTRPRPAHAPHRVGLKRPIGPRQRRPGV